MMFVHTMMTPLGPLTLQSDGSALQSALFGVPAPPPDQPHPLLTEAARQLDAYFARTRRTFDLPLAPVGTPFQQRVWAALREIPWGETRTYAGMARTLGDAKLTRAVGAANGQNPLAVLIPCHRVIGARGELVGYAGGMDRKVALLALEGALLV